MTGCTVKSTAARRPGISPTASRRRRARARGGCDRRSHSACAKRATERARDAVSYVLGIDVGCRPHVRGRRAAGLATTSSRSISATAGAVSHRCCTSAPTAAWTVGAAAERWADGEPERVVRGFPGRIGDDVPMLLAGEPWAPEELTAWLVRWVVDRVAERGGRPGGRDRGHPPRHVGRRPHRAAGRRAGRAGPRRHLPRRRRAPPSGTPPPRDDAAPVASAAACGAALALLAGDVEAERTDDGAAQPRRARAIPGDTGGQRRAATRTTARPPTCRPPAPTTRATGGRGRHTASPTGRWAQADAGERRVEGSGAHEAPRRGLGRPRGRRCAHPRIRTARRRRPERVQR